MSYYRVLLFRWSRRDVLAVVALTVIVAFLTGSALFYTAAKDRPTALASQYQPAGEAQEFQSVERARQASGAGDVVLAFAKTDSPDRIIVGIAPDDQATARELGLGLPTPPASGLGTRASPAEDAVRVEQGGSSVTLTVTGISDSGIFPDRWYVARQSLVEEIGPSGALVISDPPDGESADRRPGATGRSQTVLRGTLLFFERGADQVLHGFALLVAGAGVLGAVTITSVVRMTVRDRIETIQIVRATGATPARVTGLFAARGVLLAGAAVAGGYAVGVIVSSVTASLSVFAGLSTTLSPRVQGDAIPLLAFVYLAVLAVGFWAGAVAALPAVRKSPAALSNQSPRNGRFDSLQRRFGASFPSHLQTNLLDWRAVIPTAATIAVFASLVFLVLSGGVIAEPLAGNESATVLDSDAIHPVASSVPASLATEFRENDVAASPEILIFGVVDDEPTIVRGARYESFASVSDATLVRGREPSTHGEAAIGRDLARTHDLAVGDTVAVGSGLRTTVERVRIVGEYSAPSAYDDQILVSLPAARHLTRERDGSVDFIRLDRNPGSDALANGVQILSVAVGEPATTPNVTATVSVANAGTETRTRNVSVEFGDEAVTKSVTLEPGARQEVEAQFSALTSGTYALTVENRSQNVSVRDQNEMTIQGLPETVPLGSEPTIQVRTVTGQPAANATLTVDNETYSVSANGSVRVPFETAGEAAVRASAEGQSTTQRVRVRENVPRHLQTGLSIRPDEVRELTAPTAVVRLSNPWNTTVRRAVAVQGPAQTYRQPIAVPPGETVTREVELSRRPPGEYAVNLSLNGTQVEEVDYRVVGDDRISAVALQNTNTASGGSLGIALATVFGNLQVIVAALIALAGLMVSGALVASFARTIHARRRTLGIYRATGASPRQVVSLIVRDGLLVGTVGVVAGIALAAGLLTVLESRDLLVFFGIRVVPSFAPVHLIQVGAVALALVLVGVLVPALSLVRRPPATLFTDRTSGRHEPSTGPEDDFLGGESEQYGRGEP